MKPNHLRFAQALLLLQSIVSPSDAFQIPINRKILSPSWTRSSSSNSSVGRLPSVKKSVAPKAGALRTKLSHRFGSLPKLISKSKQVVAKNPKNKQKTTYISKEILALVTTCCLSIILRPTPAHAAPARAAAISSIFLDGPFDELEGLGVLPNNCLPGMQFLGFVLRKLLVSVGCLLLATSLARSAVDSVEYWAALGDAYGRLFNEEEETSDGEGSKEITESRVLPNPSMGFNWAVMGGLEEADDTKDKLIIEESEGVTIKAAKEWNKAKHVDWDEYSHTLLSSSQKKNSAAFVGTLGKHTIAHFADMMQKVLCSPDQQLIMSLVADNDNTAKETQAQEEALLHQAQRYFQEQKTKLHDSEQEVFGYYVPKSDSFEDSAKSTWREYKRELDKTKVKQDVVADATRKEVGERMNIMKNLLTWDDYKHLVGELQKSKEEVKELKQELEHLNSVMHIEQSIHQAVATSSTNPPPEVHEEDVTAATSPDTKERHQKTRNELSDLEEKAKYYEQTMMESASSFLAMEGGEYDGEEVTVQDDLGSGIK